MRCLFYYSAYPLLALSCSYEQSTVHPGKSRFAAGRSCTDHPVPRYYSAGSIGKGREYTPEDAAFDTAFFTPPADVYGKAELYSADGRRSYIRARWTFDLVFPLSYGFFCLTALAFICRVLFGGRFRWVLIAPLAGVLFDLAENSFVTAVLLTTDTPSTVLAWGVSLSTLLKWVFVNLSFIAALIGLSAAVIVLIIRKARGPINGK
jgi:hypothetical protein